MSLAEGQASSRPGAADAVLNSLPHPVLVIGPDGRIADANVAAETFFEVSVSLLRRNAMRDLGYIEGQNLVLELGYLEGRIDRAPEVVAELVGLKVDVIESANNLATRAAKEATTSIPIVMATGGTPVEQGLVASLAPWR